MRAKRVTRFYCDHCSRGMFQRPAMERHEITCFRNPNRKCCACEAQFDPIMGPMAFVFENGTVKDGQVKLKSGSCPECMMAMVIRNNVGSGFEHDDWIHYSLEDFKKDKMERDRDETRYSERTQ